MTRFFPVLGNDWVFIARRPGKIMPTGCKQCQDLGYSGRTGVLELWRLDEEDCQLIMNHANEHALRARLAGKSHQALVHDAFAKVLNGTTSLAEMRKLTGITLPVTSSKQRSLRRLLRPKTVAGAKTH